METKRRKSPLLLLLALVLHLSIAVSGQQKEIAVTFDDLPLNGPSIRLSRLKKMTGKILEVIRKDRIPAVGFVNESQLYVSGETDARIEILRMWTGAGVELGNHTFTHLGFKNASLSAYQDDFIRGETISTLLVKPNKIRYFRHPFLQMGDTRELEEQFEKFIGERGYRTVPVTIDTMDWMFLAAYAKSVDDKDKRLRRQVSAEYLKFVDLRIDASEKISEVLFGRRIKHILLLHANELNKDNFEEIVGIFRNKGYQFISVEEALQDPVYRFPENYSPTSDWLSHWANSQGKRLEIPQPPQFIRNIYEGK